MSASLPRISSRSGESLDSSKRKEPGDEPTDLEDVASSKSTSPSPAPVAAFSNASASEAEPGYHAAAVHPLQPQGQPHWKRERESSLPQGNGTLPTARGASTPTRGMASSAVYAPKLKTFFENMTTRKTPFASSAGPGAGENVYAAPYRNSLFARRPTDSFSGADCQQQVGDSPPDHRKVTVCSPSASQDFLPPEGVSHKINSIVVSKAVSPKDDALVPPSARSRSSHADRAGIVSLRHPIAKKASPVVKPIKISPRIPNSASTKIHPEGHRGNSSFFSSTSLDGWFSLEKGKETNGNTGVLLDSASRSEGLGVTPQRHLVPHAPLDRAKGTHDGKWSPARPRATPPPRTDTLVFPSEKDSRGRVPRSPSIVLKEDLTARETFNSSPSPSPRRKNSEAGSMRSTGEPRRSVEASFGSVPPHKQKDSDSGELRRVTSASTMQRSAMSTGPTNGKAAQMLLDVNEGEMYVDNSETKLYDDARTMTFTVEGAPKIVQMFRSVTNGALNRDSDERRAEMLCFGPFPDVRVAVKEQSGGETKFTVLDGFPSLPPRSPADQLVTPHIIVDPPLWASSSHDNNGTADSVRNDRTTCSVLVTNAALFLTPSSSVDEQEAVGELPTESTAIPLSSLAGVRPSYENGIGVELDVDDSVALRGSRLESSTSTFRSGGSSKVPTGAGGESTATQTILLVTQDAEGIIDAIMRCSFAHIRAMSNSQKRKLTIVHFNDVYNLLPTTPATSTISGGAARFHTILQSIRARAVPLVLFSGDFMGPSLMSVDMKGRQMIDCFNTLGVHYACFGNHEFDYGLKAMHDSVCGFTHGPFVYTGSTTQWVMSNMMNGDGTPLCGALDRALFTWNGVQVGIMGLCDNWISGCGQLKPNDIVYTDIYERGETIASELRSNGAEVVIALTHSRLRTDKEVMRRCPSIDLLLGGHDHFYKCVPELRIVKSGEEFKFLTEITVELDDSNIKNLASSLSHSVSPLPSSVSRNAAAAAFPTSKSVLVDSRDMMSGGSMNEGDEKQPQNGAPGQSLQLSSHSLFSAAQPVGMHFRVALHPVLRAISPFPIMERMIGRYVKKLDDRMGGVIGITNIDLDPREVTVRFKEGVLTGFICDVIANEMTVNEQKVDFAVLGGAAISGKTIIPKGYLTLGNIFNLFPNDTKVMAARLSGRTVLKLLTMMTEDMPKESPSFPHCSESLRFTINLIKRPASIESVFVNNERLDMDRKYLVALEDFAAKGSGKYKFIPREGEVLTDEDNEPQIVYWVSEYFTAKKGQRQIAESADHAQQAGNAQTSAEKSARDATGKGAGLDNTPQTRFVTNVPSNVATPKATPKNRLPVSYFNALEFAASLNAATLARVYAASSLLTSMIGVEQNSKVHQHIICRLLKCQTVRIYWLDENSGMLNVSSGTMMRENHKMRSIPADENSIAGYCVVHMCSVNVLDVSSEPSFNPDADGFRSMPTKTMLSFPVMFKNRCLGVVQAINKQSDTLAAVSEFEQFSHLGLSVSSNELPSGHPHRKSSTSTNEESTDERMDWSMGDGFFNKSYDSSLTSRMAAEGVATNASAHDLSTRTFSREDVGLALLLAQQIGVQMHYGSVARSLELSEMATHNLMEMVRILGRSQYNDSVAEMVLRVTEVAKQIIGCDRCSLYLVEKGDMWTVVKSNDMSTNVTIRLPIGHGIAGTCVRDGKLMNVHDAYQSPNFNRDYDKKTGYRTRTILCVPIFSERKDSILGVLQLINKNDGKVFAAADERLAEHLVSVAAIAINNSFEIETLRVGRDDSTLQVLPVHEPNRITIKGGWHTIRERLSAIASPEFKERVQSVPLGLSDSAIPNLLPSFTQNTSPETEKIFLL